MSLLMTCPCCRQSFELREAREDEAWREFVEALISLPNHVQPAVLRYLELFRPAKQSSLRSSSLLSLLSTLKPLLIAQQFERGGKTYVASVERFVGAMDYLHSQQAKLTLPLKGHGYLLETLASVLERTAAKAEQAQQEQLRSGVIQRPSTPSPIQSTVDTSLPTLTPEQRAANFKRLSEMLNNPKQEENNHE